ncbi:MAG: F-type H+-transporting ATPase subunit gamma [Patescibacteria group bacterium]|nr:ATP synthase F1 subunit gamma [Candidatus Saccharibacteria bacterium]MDQ5963078.1 F-type H+-transporting ATPase subunit gamma [Patescibacteria group bacterium]
MASTRQLKSRIRSVKNTKQITKAMQMVAASKMRKAQEATRATHDYTVAANELLTNLARQGATNGHPLFTKHGKIKSRLLIVITSDKGLAGAYNANVLKTYLAQLKRDRDRGVKNHTITVGRKVSQFVSRLKDVESMGSYNDLPDEPTGAELSAIIGTAYDMYIKDEVDAVDMIFTEFVSSMTQIPKIQPILPAGFEETEVSDFVREATYEPGTEEVLNGVAYRLIEAQLFQALLDARASEHSMRMLAMKNATDNATELAEDLTLEMNKARQAAITQELAEISGGSEAMK